MGTIRVRATAGPEVISLGCRLNFAESERIRGLLASDPSVVVVNSCAVTAEAVRHTRQTIRRLRRERPDARLLVTGCAAEVAREQLAAMPEIDGLIPNASKLDARAWNVAEAALPALPRRTRAFVAVQNGCDHACTFCIIPQGRGASRSNSVVEVLREVERHLAAGAREVVLTGVDVTSWGADLTDTPGLGTLVAAILDEFPDLARLRMSSVDGAEIDPMLFDLLASEARVMPHLHLSLQHGADLILKRMKRRHSRAQALELVARLRQARPDIAIGADLIAGFPTETAAHHADNLSIINELAIVHGHIFPFSPRIGTPAAHMPQLVGATIRARAGELRAAVAAERQRWLQSLVGQNMAVLAEQGEIGHAPNFAPVALPSGTVAGTVVNITPTQIEQGMLR